MRFIEPGLPCAIALALATGARADVLYTVDYQSNQLLVVDSVQGTRSVVGPLGLDVFDVDLGRLNGVLYATDAHGSGAAPYTDLLVIDQSTGLVTSSVRVKLAGGDVYVEGLASASGQLWACCDSGTPGSSGVVAPVDPLTGALGSVTSFSTFSADMDGLGADAGGVFHSVDANSGTLSSRLHVLGFAPATYTMLSGPWGSSSNPIGINDLVFTATGLFGIDNYSGRIHRFNPSSGELLASVALAPSAFPLGLEYAGPSPTAYCTAKQTSNGCVPAIGAQGIARASAAAGFVVTGSQMINNKSCLLFYGLSGQAAGPFQGGTLCVKVPIKRTPGTTTAGNPPPNDCSGVPHIDMSSFAAGGLGGSPDPGLGVIGSIVRCQWWGRDPGYAAPNNTMLSNALEYAVVP